MTQIGIKDGLNTPKSKRFDQIRSLDQSQIDDQDLDQRPSNMFSTKRKRKQFLRSSPKPGDTVKTQNERLINNKNSFNVFLTKNEERYKVKVFENFKSMNS